MSKKLCFEIRNESKIAKMETKKQALATQASSLKRNFETANVTTSVKEIEKGMQNLKGQNRNKNSELGH